SSCRTSADEQFSDSGARPRKGSEPAVPEPLGVGARATRVLAFGRGRRVRPAVACVHLVRDPVRARAGRGSCRLGRRRAPRADRGQARPELDEEDVVTRNDDLLQQGPREAPEPETAEQRSKKLGLKTAGGGVAAGGIGLAKAGILGKTLIW